MIISFAALRPLCGPAHSLAAQGIGCEVLVIDDCSRDGSQRLLLRLATMDHRGLLHVIANDQKSRAGRHA